MKILLLIPVLVFSQFSSQAQRAQKQAQQVITLKLMPVAILHKPDNPGKGKTPTTPPSKNMLVQTEVVSGTQTSALLANASATAQQTSSQQNAANSKYVVYTLSSL